MRIVPLALGFSLLASTASAQSAGDGSALFEVTWVSTWSAQTHPVQFPSGAHYSALVGATHDASVSFWAPGQLATPGIKDVAELGANTRIRNEVNAAIGTGAADQYLSHPPLSTSPSQRTVQIRVQASHAQLTLVSMIAPSPDWFVGVHGLDLIQNGAWVDNLTVDLYAYDAGTDSGVTYTSANQPTNPAQPIARVTTASGPFQGLPGPVGSLTVRYLGGSLVYGCNASGSMAVSQFPSVGQSIAFHLDDPMGQGPALTAVALADGPDPMFPCGSPLAGVGVPVLGNQLVTSPFDVATGPIWNGMPTMQVFSIPANNSLVGLDVYAQGLLATAGQLVLTDAAAVRLSN